jgi:tetratricopeptide (TPR) repeat protein
MSAEGTRDRSLALLGLAEVADRRGNSGRSALLYDQLLTGLGIPVPAGRDFRPAPESRAIVEEALHGLAEARRSLGQEEAALPLYESLTVLFPESRYAGGALFTRGEILESLGRLEQAMESYRSLGARTEPGDLALRARRRAARVNEKLGWFDEAEAGMRDLLGDLVGKDIPMAEPEAVVFEEAVRYDLGSLLLTVGRNAEAASAFRRNLERFGEGPGMMRNRAGLAHSLYNSGEYGDAADEYESLVRDGGESRLVADAMLWLGWSYENLGRREDARTTWKGLEDRYPASEAAPLAAAAWAQQFEMSEPGRAAGLWARLSEVYQGRSLAPVALFRAGLLALESVGPATAARHFRRYREVYPDGDRVGETFLWEGVAEEARGAWEPAREAYRAFLDRSGTAGGEVPEDLRAKALTGLARSLRGLGDPHGAMVFLEGELAEPGREAGPYREVWALLGDLYFEVGRPSSALPAYRKVVAMGRGDRLEAETELSIAECLEEMELPKEAALEYVKVAYLFDSVPDLATVGMIRAAGLFERLGNYREAMRSYRRALELEPTEEQREKITKRVAWLEEHLGLLELDLKERK